MVKIGARAISPQQGSGQRDFMRVGGEPLFVELVDGDDGWRCIEEVVGHVRELLRLVRDAGKGQVCFFKKSGADAGRRKLIIFCSRPWNQLCFYGRSRTQ